MWNDERLALIALLLLGGCDDGYAKKRAFDKAFDKTFSDMLTDCTSRLGGDQVRPYGAEGWAVALFSTPGAYRCERLETAGKKYLATYILRWDGKTGMKMETR